MCHVELCRDSTLHGTRFGPRPAVQVSQSLQHTSQPKWAVTATVGTRAAVRAWRGQCLTVCALFVFLQLKTRQIKGTSGGTAFQFGACKDSQTAADTNGLSGSAYTGAATYSFIEAVEKYGPQQTYARWAQ